MTDFTIIRGDNITINILLKDENNTPINLTDYTIYFTVKKNQFDTDENASLKQTVTDIETPENGTVTLVFTKEDTQDLIPGTHFWDLQLKKDDVITSTEMKTLTVDDDITRRTNGD
jgi:hypothetical protein